MTDTFSHHTRIAELIVLPSYIFCKVASNVFLKLSVTREDFSHHLRIFSTTHLYKEASKSFHKTPNISIKRELFFLPLYIFLYRGNPRILSVTKAVLSNLFRIFCIDTGLTVLHTTLVHFLTYSKYPRIFSSMRENSSHYRRLFSLSREIFESTLVYFL